LNFEKKNFFFKFSLTALKCGSFSQFLPKICLQVLGVLTPKVPRHFLAQKPLKTAMSAAFIQETKKYTSF